MLSGPGQNERRTKCMDGYEFENVCAEYLRAHGFRKVLVTQASRDQGADIIAQRKKEKYAFQCKYYSTPVGNKAVQEVYAAAAFYGCDCAAVMTNNTFTKGAGELAESLGVELMPGIEPMKRRFGALDGMMVLPVLFLLSLLAFMLVKPKLPETLSFLRGERLASYGNLFSAAAALVIVGGFLFFLRHAFLGMLLCLGGAGAVWFADGIPGEWKHVLLLLAAFCAGLCLLRTLAAIPGRIRARRRRKDEEALAAQQEEAEEQDEESASALPEEQSASGEETDALGETDPETPQKNAALLSENVLDVSAEAAYLKGSDEEAGEDGVETGYQSGRAGEIHGLVNTGRTGDGTETEFSESPDKIHQRAVLYELIGIAEKTLMETDKPAERERILATLEDAYKMVQEGYRRE